MLNINHSGWDCWGAYVLRYIIQYITVHKDGSIKKFSMNIIFGVWLGLVYSSKTMTNKQGEITFCLKTNMRIFFNNSLGTHFSY